MRVSPRYIARVLRSKVNKNGGQQMPVSVRYIVDDIDTAIPFYRDMLDFNVDMHFGQAFASLSRGDLRLLLNKPGGGGGAGQTMPDGHAPAPGGCALLPDRSGGASTLLRRS